MSTYSTGKVTVLVGSANVRGIDTDFITNVVNGDLFKLTGENSWYTVADVVGATALTLSSRYANSTYWTATYEHVASAIVATKTYSGTLSNTPVIQNYAKFKLGDISYTDDGAGVLTGDDSPAGSGTVGYDDGAWAITLGTYLATHCDIIASHYYGQSRSVLPYQIIRDFTSNYSIPEMSLNDIDFPAIYTKGIRIVDEKINSATAQRGLSFFYKSSVSVATNCMFSLVPYSTQCSEVRAQVDNVASGCSIVLDVLKNKVSMLNATKLVIPAGSTTASCSPASPLITAWDAISLNIDKVGSIVAGGDSLCVTLQFLA